MINHTWQIMGGRFVKVDLVKSAIVEFKPEDHPVIVVELDAASARQVQGAIEAAAADNYRLDQMAVCMDTDGARYYTLVFVQRPTFEMATLEDLEYVPQDFLSVLKGWFGVRHETS